MSILRAGGQLIRAGGGLGRVSGRSTLASSDLTYLGKFLPPADNGSTVRFASTYGAITGRRVGGDIRLFMMGRFGNDIEPVYEFTYPGAATSGSLPQATMVRNWGTQPFTDASGVNDLRHRTGSGGQYTTRGLRWYDNKLWWAYGNFYNTAGHHDASIGVGVLNDATGTAVGYGTWRTQEHSQRTRGYLVEAPDDFSATYLGGKKLLVGAPITSGNAASPYGPFLVTLDTLPSTATAADPYESGNAANYTISASQYLLRSDTSNRAARSDWYECGWNVIYDCAQGTFVNTRNTFGELDTMTGAAWVRTTSKAGLVMVGQLVGDTSTGAHKWYGPAYPATCCHGQSDGYQTGTGDQTSRLEPRLWIYSEADLAAASTNPTLAYSVTPSVAVSLLTYSSTHFYQHSPQYWAGGMWFDETARLLFISHTFSAVEGASGELAARPVIHVLEVAD